MTLRICSRILAGTLGAYGLTALATVAVSRVLIRLGADPVEAVTGVTLASFALFAGVSMTIFHAPSTARAWFWLLALALPCGLAVLALSAE